MIFMRPLISVVDDDDSVRESLPDLLGELGFAVQAFASSDAVRAGSGRTLDGSTSIRAIGSVSIDGSSKEVSAEAVNGSVEVSGSPSRVHAGTVNGGIASGSHAEHEKTAIQHPQHEHEEHG